MNKQEVKQIVMKGEIVKCSQGEYPDVRRYLQEIAGESIDEGQSVYAAIALGQVASLDRVFRVAEQWDGADQPIPAADERCPHCDCNPCIGEFDSSDC